MTVLEGAQLKKGRRGLVNYGGFSGYSHWITSVQGGKGCLRLVALSTESVAPVSVKTRRSSLPIASELSLFLEQAQSIRRTKGLTWEDCLKCFSLRQSFFQWPGFLFKWQTSLEFEGFDLVCWSLWEESDSCWTSKFMILVVFSLFELWTKKVKMLVA